MGAGLLTVSELFVSFQGEGLHAGRRQLFVRLAGCPLRCRWCDTPDSLVAARSCRVLGPDGERRLPNPLPVAELAGLVGELAAASPPLHAVAITGGEPLQQADALGAWLAAAPPALPVLLETAGIWPDRLAGLVPRVAIVSLDVKLPSNTGEAARWDEHAACVRVAVDAGRDTYVKMPVDEQTAVEEVERGATLVAAAGRGIPLFLTPIAGPAGSGLAIRPATLEQLQAAASRVHDDVRVLPQLHKVLGIL